MDTPHLKNVTDIDALLKLLPPMAEKLIAGVYDRSGRIIIPPDLNLLIQTTGSTKPDLTGRNIKEILRPPLGLPESSESFNHRLFPEQTATFSTTLHLFEFAEQTGDRALISFLQKGIPAFASIRHLDDHFFILIHPMPYFMERAKGRLTEDMMALLGKNDEVLAFCGAFNSNLMATNTIEPLRMEQLTTSPQWPKLLGRDKKVLEYFSVIKKENNRPWQSLHDFSSPDKRDWVEDLGSEWSFEENAFTVKKAVGKGFLTYLNPVEQVRNDLRVCFKIDLENLSTVGCLFHINIYRASSDTGTPDFDGYNIGLKRLHIKENNALFYLKRRQAIIQEKQFTLPEPQGNSTKSLELIFEKIGGLFTLYINGQSFAELTDSAPLSYHHYTYLGLLATPETRLNTLRLLSRPSLFEPRKIPSEIEDLTFYKYPGHVFETRMGTLFPTPTSDIRYVYMKDVTHSRGLLEKLNSYLNDIEDELETAKRIQSILANIPIPNHPALRFAYHYRPSKQVGGDLLDIKDFGQGRYALLIYDVSGHGIAASLVSAMAKMSFDNALKKTQSPATVMELVNADICAVTQASMFLTAFLAVLDVPAGKLTYARAGHCLPGIFSATRKSSPILLKEGGPILGNSTAYEYQEHSVPIEAGDRLFLYTDGIIEIRDSKDFFFDKTKLFNILQHSLGHPVDDVKQIIIRAIEDFVQGGSFEDDITFLLTDIKHIGPTAGDEP